MSRKIIFIFTRYSIFIPNAAGFELSQGTFDPAAYRQKLFNPGRLSLRRTTFQAVAARSIAEFNPCDAEIHFVVLTSDLLPESEAQALQQIMNDIHTSRGFTTSVQFVKSEQPDPIHHTDHASYPAAIDDYIQETVRHDDNVTFATVRLDDDDALGKDFALTLTKHLKPDLAGYGVTFPYGLQGRFDPGTATFSDVRRFYRPMVAIGLGMINHWSAESGYADKRIQVYRLGFHTRLIDKCSLIVDASCLGYLKSITTDNDSGAHAYHEHLPLAEQDEVSESNFGCLTGLSAPARDTSVYRNIQNADKLLAERHAAIASTERRVRREEAGLLARAARKVARTIRSKG